MTSHPPTPNPLLLLSRALGILSPQAVQRSTTTQLLHALDAAPRVQFDGGGTSSHHLPGRGNPTGSNTNTRGEAKWAQRAGVNCLVVDGFEGKLMLSGGAEGSILLWDLERIGAENTIRRGGGGGGGGEVVYRPVGGIGKSSTSHKFGVTHLSFYPFDSLAFLSSSYDHTLKLYATETLKPSASFDLTSVIYSHALSPIATHLLVACATKHPAIRLVDLRSGASAHSLAGHQAAVLSVAWSPQDENILASGGSDGTIRLWDIRRSAGCVGVLDLEDSVGVVGEDGLGKSARPRGQGKAHVGPCNGVSWTDDGKYLISAGHDERVRVWDISTGANTLSHFGPIIQNTQLSTLLPLLPPSHLVPPGAQVMMYPNEKEILMFDLFEGTLLKRLRVVKSAATATATAAAAAGPRRDIKSKITSLAWRAGSIEMFSGHSDGMIRAWMPRTTTTTMGEDDEDELGLQREGPEGENEARKRKREALDGVFRDLTRQKITFI